MPVTDPKAVTKDLFNRIAKLRDCHTFDKSKVRNDISKRLCEERSDVAISNDLWHNRSNGEEDSVPYGSYDSPEG